MNGMQNGPTHSGQGSSHLSDWQESDALPMSRSASNATGQMVENARVPVKNAVKDSTKICMGERPGNHAIGSGASPELAPGPSKPSMQQVATPARRSFSGQYSLAKQSL